MLGGSEPRKEIMSEQIALTAKQPTEVIKENKIEASISKDTNHQPLYELFDVTKSERIDQDLSLIWDYAKDRAENKDKDSVLYEVIRLKNRLKSPDVGEKPYLRVLLYVREYMKMREAEKRLEELNG